MVHCKTCAHCSSANKMKWHDENDTIISEWLYNCDLAKDYICEEMAETGECPNYVEG